MAASSSVDHQLAVLDAVAERHETAHPHALLAGRRELVADAFANHLALELGKGQQDVKREPAHRRRRVERLRDADKGNVPALEHFDQLGEVHERARQAVDLVDHHDVDLASFDVGQEPLQCRALQRSTETPAVVIAIRHQRPALRLLAGNVRLARLPLRVEAVELHVEAFLGGFAGVDRAADLRRDLCLGPSLLHPRDPFGLGRALLAKAASPFASPARVFLRPKKTQPFQRVPVMARAIEDSDL